MSLLWLESNKVFDNQSYIFSYIWKKINFTGQILRIVCYPIAQWNRFQPLNWKNVKCFLSQSPKIKLRNMNWNIRWHLGSTCTTQMEGMGSKTIRTLEFHATLEAFDLKSYNGDAFQKKKSYSAHIWISKANLMKCFQWYCWFYYQSRRFQCIRIQAWLKKENT